MVRLGRLPLSLLLAAGLLLPASGLAQSDENGQGLNGERVGPDVPSPTYGPNGPDVPGAEGSSGAERRWHQPREVYSRNSDPILAERPGRPGKYYDARPDGQRERGTLGPDRVQDVREREKLYDQSKSVTVYEGSLGEIDGMDPNAGYGVGQGRLGDKFDPEKENGATIAGCVACVDGQAQGQVGITRRGVQANVDARIGAYVGRAEGGFAAMDRDGVVTGGVKGEGSAYLLGAEARANGTLEASLDRVLANGRVGAHLGGRAEGQLTGNIGLNNIGEVEGTVKGEISYGLGAQAEGYFEFDWSTMSVRAGGKLSATLGIGAGVGFETKISVKPAVDWAVDNVGRPVANAVGDAYRATTNAVGNAYDSVTGAVGDAWDALPCIFGCDDPKPASTMPEGSQSGSAVARNSSTGPMAQVPVYASTPYDSGRSGAAAAGMARD